MDNSLPYVGQKVRSTKSGKTFSVHFIAWNNERDTDYKYPVKYLVLLEIGTGFLKCIYYPQYIKWVSAGTIELGHFSEPELVGFPEGVTPGSF